MTLLKKLGQIILKVGQIAIGLGPLVGSVIPQIAGMVQTISRDIGEVIKIIANVEAIGVILGLGGDQKLKAAIPLVADSILHMDFMVGQKIKNQELYIKGSQEITQGVVDILNSLDEDGIEEVSKLVG